MNPRFHPRPFPASTSRLIALTGLCALAGMVSRLAAETLVSGVAQMDLDPAAWNTLASGIGSTPPVLVLDAFFDQEAANARDYGQILADASPVIPTYAGQRFVMNGPTVTNQTGRTTQPTTFAYTPGDLTNHTGSIGLGGITRFRVSSGGNLLYGDFTLFYSATRHRFGGSGWHLKGNIAPSVAAFDLLNPQIQESPEGFTLSGDLAVSFEIANFLYATPSDALRDVGDFTFTGRLAVASQAALLAAPEQVGDSWRIRAIGGSPGASFTLRASPDPTLPSASWTLVASGTLDGAGAASIPLPISVATPSGFFRLLPP